MSLEVSFVDTARAITAAGRSETPVPSQVLAKEMMIVVILVLCRLLSGVGRWGLQRDFDRVYSPSLSSSSLLNAVAAQSLFPGYFLLCNKWLLPTITTFLAPHQSSRNVLSLSAILSFAPTAHDEIHTFSFAFSLPTQTNSLPLQWKVSRPLKWQVVGRAMPGLFYSSTSLTLKAIKMQITFLTPL